MSETRKVVAVPSNAPGGLEASPSAHFGHCDVYTLAVVGNGVVSDVRVVPNAGHEHGNCLAPVQTLAGMGVNALIAGGMGMRPLAGLNEAGVTVYHSTGLPTVEAVLRAFAEGKLSAFGTDNLCRGHCGRH